MRFLIALVTACAAPSTPASTTPAGGDDTRQLSTELDAITRADTGVVEVVHAVPSVAVDVKPLQFVGWTIAVHNDSDAMVRVVWSDSSFVGTNGVSYGPLVESIDAAHTAPLQPTLIPPHSVGGRPVATERRLAPAVQDGSDAAGMRAAISYRREVATATSGGTMYLTVEANDQKQLWSGRLGSAAELTGSRTSP